jgi:Cohesin domain
MTRNSKRMRLLTIMFALILVPRWFAGSAEIESSEKRNTRQEGAKAVLAQNASLRSITAQKDQPSEAMTSSQPVLTRLQDIVTSPTPLRESDDAEEAIESDIDPATMRLLKGQDYKAPPSMAPTHQHQQDPAQAKGSTLIEPPLAPNLLGNFESIDNGDQLDGFLHRPPDCAMAAGQNHVIAAVNSIFVIYNKTGSIAFQSSLTSWFSNVCVSQCSPFDPRVAYDSQANRWLLLAVNGGSSTPNLSNYLLSVSQTSDPTGLWWNYSLNGVLTYPGTGENTWSDFPQLGFDGISGASGGAVYITSNQFTFGAASFRTAMLNILPKSSLYSGGALNYWRAWDRLNSDGSQSFGLSPTLTYGNPGGVFLINSKNTGNFVSLWKVVPTFPPTAVNWALQSTNNIGAYTIPPDATQPGGCALMATNDSRIPTNAVWRNNRIYAALTEGFNWGSGTVAAIRYIQINTSSNATEQNVTFGADGLHYFFPAVATDSSDNVVLTFARSNPAEFGNIRFTGRLAAEPVGFQASALLKGGNLCITGDRWGDYFAAAVDPADTTKIWIYGAWAADVPGVPLPWDWGTWIGQVQFGTPVQCPTVSSISPTSGSVGSNVTITGNNFTGVTAVKFSNNVTAAFTVNSNTQITTTVPAGAVTGPITISKTGCNDVQTGTFTVGGSCLNQVSIPTNLTGGTGSTVTVPINVTNLSGLGVTAYDFVLTFNQSIVQPASPAFDTAGTLSSGMTITPNTSVAGRITVSAFGTTPLSGAGTLLNLRFNVTGTVSQCSNLTWTSFRFNEGTPCSTTSNGQVCIGGGGISGTVNFCIASPARPVPGVLVSAAGSPAGSSTTDAAGNYNISNLGGGAYTATPTKTGQVNGISSFDASLVAQHVAQLITLTSCQQAAGDASNNGSLSSFDASLIAQTVAGITNPGIAGTWKFVPSSRTYPTLSGNQVNQNYDALLVGDVSGNWTASGPIPQSSDQPQVTVYLQEEAKTTGTMLIPIIVGDLTGRGVQAYDFTLVFDPSVLKFKGLTVDKALTLSRGMTITANTKSPGQLIISAFGTSNLSGAGRLLNIEFKVLSGSKSRTDVTLQSFTFNEGMPGAYLMRGR